MMIKIGQYAIPESSIACVDTEHVRKEKDTNHFGTLEERQVKTVRIQFLTSNGKDMPYLDIAESHPDYEATKSYFSQGSHLVDIHQAQEAKTATKKKSSSAEEAAA